MPDNSTQCHATQAEQQCWPLENFFDCITLELWSPNSLDYNVWGAVEQETNKIPWNTKDEMEATFTNLNKKTIKEICNRFWSCLETVVEANGDFFE